MAKQYDNEFKVMISRIFKIWINGKTALVRLWVLNGGMIRRWKGNMKLNREISKKREVSPARSSELKALQKELRGGQEERDIFKKAVEHFSKERAHNISFYSRE